MNSSVAPKPCPETELVNQPETCGSASKIAFSKSESSPNSDHVNALKFPSKDGPNFSERRIPSIPRAADIEQSLLSKKEASVDFSRDVPSMPINDAIKLSDWCLAIVPNNPSITKIDRSRCSEWIVLVGRRAGMNEMWHSSLITNRLSENQVCTGSGRVYQLEGSIHTSELIETGFSFGIAEAFKHGFPWNWKDLLISDLTRIKHDASKVATNDDVQNSVKKSTLKSVSSQPLAVECEPVRQKSVRKINTDSPSDLIPAKKSSQIKKNSKSQKIKVQSKASENTPSFKAGESTKKISHKSYFNESDSGSDYENESPIDEGDDKYQLSSSMKSTRSGRKVQRPQPYWDSGKESFKRSTRRSNQENNDIVLPKRCWGNKLAM